MRAGVHSALMEVLKEVNVNIQRGAGLRGAGNAVSDGEVAAMTVEGGAAGYLAIVVRLLKATFA